MTRFHETLPAPQREALFAFMRELQADSDFYMARGRETPGTIPVGSALFDEVIKGAVRLELVMALGQAATLEAAHAKAAEATRLWVKKHNEKRKDKDWQRWCEHGQTNLSDLVARLRRILGAEFISREDGA